DLPLLASTTNEGATLWGRPHLLKRCKVNSLSSTAAYSDVLTGIRQQRHVTGPLDRHSHLALQFGVGACFAAGANATVIAHKVAQAIQIFPIHLFDFDGANSPAARKIAATSVEVTTTAALTIVT